MVFFYLVVLLFFYVNFKIFNKYNKTEFMLYFLLLINTDMQQVEPQEWF